MSALLQIIRRLIGAGGPITVERFMELALADPNFGYYATRDPFGADGDFVTAPEISQMFGEMICVWCADYWTRMGAPRQVRLVELGPGRGTLMQDFLRAARIVPGFLEALDVDLVETSPVLRRIQQSNLAGAGARVQWFDSFEATPDGPMLLIANEFFDALPVRHYVRTAEGWRSRVVTTRSNGGLAFSVSRRVETNLALDAPDGAILEVNLAARRIMAAIAARIARRGGAALAIDYGYTRTQFGETLQALRAHAYVDPLAEPGEADLTTHVDFAALERAAHGAGASTHGPATQGEFLARLGIRERANVLAAGVDATRADVIQSELARLIGGDDGGRAENARGGGMGALFKVLAVTQNGGPEPAGFSDAPADD